MTAIEALHNAGIEVFVLGFGGGVNNNPKALEAMAQAGGTNHYYAANSPDDLGIALDDIIGKIGIASCIYTLDDEPRDPSALGVSVDGTSIPRDPSKADGWDYDPAQNSVTFFGPACDNIKEGNATEFSVTYGCGGIVL